VATVGRSPPVSAADAATATDADAATRAVAMQRVPALGAAVDGAPVGRGVAPLGLWSRGGVPLPPSLHPVGLVFSPCASLPGRLAETVLATCVVALPPR